jgi:CTP:molybdopterin cytidylyltransferase MocA
MGRAKQTLPYRDSTVVGTVVRTLLTAGVDAVVVVTRSELREALRLPEDRRVRVVINDDTDSEMIDSLRIGIAELSAWHPSEGDGLLVVPGDMPSLPEQVCRDCMAAFRADSSRIVIAAHGARRGHPIILPRAMCAEIAQLTGGLRELPRKHPDRVHIVPCDDDGVVRDVDRPEDYRRP